MNPSPNPYRKSGIELETRHLQEDDISSLVNNIYNEPLKIIWSKQSMFTVTATIDESILNIGYKQLRQGVYIRESAFLPSFPDSKRLAEDRFAAVYPGFFDRENILVNGKIGHSLETTLRDIEILGYMFEKSSSYNKKWRGTTINLSSSFWVGLACVIPAAIYYGAKTNYRVATKMPHISELKSLASGLSKNAKDYLYGVSALENIRDEASKVKEDIRRFRRSYLYEKLNSAGINLIPEHFDYLDLLVRLSFSDGSIKDLEMDLRKIFSDAQIKTIINVFSGVRK